jgi:hypothetical protein
VTVLGGATDPAAWGEFFGKLGPGGFVLVVMAMAVFVVVLIVGGFLLFWRGSEKWGFVGFGAEYQKHRIAQEKQTAAMERTEEAQGEIKELLARLAPFAEVLVQWLRASMQPAPIPPPVAPTNGARSSCPSVPGAH